ncbi:hypothetical protein GCM10025859_21130 [Alicyclobacillus fastidiosus]|nr:hypothetical protein GCM10025859_21130 [Alicyclobacillus fastidiosus]
MDASAEQPLKPTQQVNTIPDNSTFWYIELYLQVLIIPSLSLLAFPRLYRILRLGMGKFRDDF